MSDNPKEAYILAAGMGSRLRPYTDKVPKPMVKVWGCPIIDRSLDALAAVGVEKCVVNTHYKADVLHRNLASRTEPEIIISHEEGALLDTGGGIAAVKEKFDAPFYVLNGDAVWEDAPAQNLLSSLAEQWDSEKMDILIVLQPVETMKLTEGVGDYDIDENGRAIRSKDKSGAYMFTSLRINAPHIFDNAPQGAFSYLQLLDEAQARGRLFALVNDGMFHHISTPADLEAVNNIVQGRGSA